MAMIQAADRTSDWRDGFIMVGGRLWLDLLNTTPVIDGVDQDLLRSEGDLQRWANAAGLPESAAKDGKGMRKMTALRGTLRKAFDLLRRGKALPQDLVAGVNTLLAGHPLTLQFTATDRQLHLTANFKADLAGHVARDFAEFACDFEPERLKACHNHECSLLFYDAGKNNKRRWCSMAHCGNRDKVKRYRARQSGIVRPRGS
jgi:predicted RNA-binding Zn ribbon-like protein